MKKGWEGPIRCPLCLNFDETAKHVLLSFPFAKEVWTLSLPGNFGTINIHDNIHSLLIDWPNISPFTSLKNGNLKACWLALPKVVLWKLWLERNSRTFKDKANQAKQVVSKVSGMLGHCLRSIWWDSSGVPLSPSEEVWLHSLSPDLSSWLPLGSRALNALKIRLEVVEFNRWIKNVHKNILLFDGSSKGNPREAGGVG